jgi:Cu-Zn family superoxide dismutase
MKRKSYLLFIVMLALMAMSLGIAQAAPPSQAEEGQEYFVQADDWLSKLADRYYGDIFAWPTILEATNARAAEDDSFAVIENPDIIEIGQKLWIPTAAMEAEAMEAEATDEEAMEAEATDEEAMEAEATDEEAMEAGEPTSYALPGEAVFPEGVAYNPASGLFYVGSTTDGAIFEGDVASGEVTVFSEGGADGRTTAIGMKVDDQGQLWVAGGGTGQMFVYNTADGSLIANFTTPEAEATFINDVIVTPSGAYFTDSFRPFLFRATDTSGGQLEPWIDFTGSALEYAEGFNLNGIVATEDGSSLITVHSGRGELYRIDIETQEVTQIDLGDATVTAGDGILLVGNTLYVSRNSAGEIVPVELSEDLSQGTVGTGFSDPSLIYPTTIAAVGDGTLLVVNSQFNNREGTPVLPFSVSQIPIP